MTKFLLHSGLLLFLMSCENQPTTPDCKDQVPASSQLQNEKPLGTATSGCPEPQPNPEPIPIPTPIPDPGGDVPNEALMFEASIQFFNFEREDEVKVNKAIEIIKKVISTSEFRDKVLNFTYGGKKQFVDNDGKSNAEVYQILLDGKETLKPQLDHEMDLELELYYSWRSTVGYTYPDGLRIWMNRKFFDSYTPSEVAGNIFHEWTHKLGFDHAASYSVSRDSSVPYALGYLMEELGKKYE